MTMIMVSEQKRKHYVRYDLTYIKCIKILNIQTTTYKISNKDILSSTGNHSHHLVITFNGV